MVSTDLTGGGLLIGAAAFAAVAVTLRPGSSGRGASRMRLRFASLATVAWACVAAWVAHRELLATPLAGVLSLLLCAVWIWQLESLARWQGLPRLLRQVLNWSGPLLVLTVSGVLVWMASRTGDAPDQSWVSRVGLLYGAFGLVAMEQIYRNAASVAQPALRWMCLGIGGILVTELIPFALTVLLGQPPTEFWLVRSVLYPFCAAAIYRGARRVPEWSFGLSVSREIVFYAGSSLMIGVYLLIMGIAGWVSLTRVGAWQTPAQLSFAALAVAALTISLFSASLLKRLRVFISAHFYPQRYDYRKQWLRFTRTLAERDADATLQQRAIRALGQIVGSGYGNLWRSDSSRLTYERVAEWPNARSGATTLGADHSLPVFLARTSWLVDLRELRLRPDVYQDLVLDTASLAAGEKTLIVPLMHGEHLYGWIELERPAELPPLNYEDRDLLKTAGRQLAAHLAEFDTAAQLAEARQFETYNRMTAFIMHDLKNIAAQLRLVSQNAERHRQNPSFVDDALQTVTSSAKRMTKLIGQLNGGGSEGGTLQTIDLAHCAETACARCAGTQPVPQVRILTRQQVFADVDRLTTVIEHAVRNAQDATPAQGAVRVEVTERAGRPLLNVTDTGAGMDQQFVRDRLFRPFDTTKGSRGMGVGAFQVREYLRSLGGDVEVESEPDRGTTLRLIFAELPGVAMSRRAG